MNAAEIRPEMPVFAKGSEKKDPQSKIKVATVDHLDGASIKLNRKDSNDGSHHWIPLEWVDKVENGSLVLNRTEGEFMNERKNSNQSSKTYSNGGTASLSQEKDRDTSRSDRDSSTELSAPQEGPVAKAIESQTARIPSDAFLWSAGAAAATSAGLMMFGKKNAGNFVANWVPTILLFGLYNKIVKVAGSDRQDRSSSENSESEEQSSQPRRSETSRESMRPTPRAM